MELAGLRIREPSTISSSRLDDDATLLKLLWKIVLQPTVLLQNVGLIVTSVVIAFIMNGRITLVVLGSWPHIL